MNILVLILFKYFGFLENIITGILKLATFDNTLKIVLPIGLSFFIFTILSYLIELKRGTIHAERHLGIFAVSLVFFPKIMQGPIERPNYFFQQFAFEKRFDYERIVEGLKQMLMGYFKKVVIADRLALYVNTVYGNFDQQGGITLMIATFFYSFQIYADFSGYTDIALGSAKILGFDLTRNFNQPYFATSIKEFWNRWHISFSSWLRDYLFLPIAYFFSRKMKKNYYYHIATEKWIFLIASLITFTICGIWHGEGFNFIVWGLLFGIYLTISNWTSQLSKDFRKKFNISKKSISNRIFGILLTFILVSFAWIFFRSNSISDAIIIIKKIFSLNGKLIIVSPMLIIYSLIGVGFLILTEYNNEFLNGRYSLFYNKNAIVRYIGYIGIVLLIICFGVFENSQFIYFQF